MAKKLVFNKPLKKELAIGSKVELEHGGGKKEATKTALDHEKEFPPKEGGPNYYEELKKMEGKLELARCKTCKQIHHPEEMCSEDPEYMDTSKVGHASGAIANAISGNVEGAAKDVGAASKTGADKALKPVKPASTSAPKPPKPEYMDSDDKVGVVMHEFKTGKLHSGSGNKVKDRKQALAIAMKEAGLNKSDFSFVRNWASALFKSKKDSPAEKNLKESENETDKPADSKHKIEVSVTAVKPKSPTEGTPERKPEEEGKNLPSGVNAAEPGSEPIPETPGAKGKTNDEKAEQEKKQESINAAVNHIAKKKVAFILSKMKEAMAVAFAQEPEEDKKVK